MSELYPPGDPAGDAAVSTGLPSGKTQFAPFQIVKEPDRATPKLVWAAVTGEELTVEIKWSRLSLSYGKLVMTDVINGTVATVTPGL